MDLRLGKREGNDYYLLDNTYMSKQEWLRAVKKQVMEHGDQAKLEALNKVTYKTYGKKDSEEAALILYVSGMHNDECWKQSVGYTEETFRGLREVVDELGQKQLAFA